MNSLFIFQMWNTNSMLITEGQNIWEYNVNLLTLKDD